MEHPHVAEIKWVKMSHNINKTLWESAKQNNAVILRGWNSKSLCSSLSQGRSLWRLSKEELSTCLSERMCHSIQIINCACSPTPGNKKEDVLRFPQNMNSQKNRKKEAPESLFRYTGRKCIQRWKETLFQLWQPLSPTPVKWVSAPSLDPTPPFYVIQVRVNFPACLFHTESHQDPLSCICTSNHLCSQRRQALKISSGSVFHLIGSRACWPTARRWRPRRPCGRPL